MLSDPELPCPDSITHDIIKIYRYIQCVLKNGKWKVLGVRRYSMVDMSKVPNKVACTLANTIILNTMDCYTNLSVNDPMTLLIQTHTSITTES